MKRVFISFSSTEIDKANRICSLLEEAGINCFIANRDLVPGKEYAQQLIENMDECGAVVLLLSKASNDSPHVLREVEYAVSNNIPIVVYQLEEVELKKSMKYFLMTHQWVTGYDNREKLLVESVSKILENNTPKCSDKGANTESQNKNDKKKLAPKYLLFIGIVIVLLFIIAVLGVLLLKNRNDNVEPEVVEEPVPEIEVNAGDTVVFGKYYDEPIEWRVIKINEDDTVVLLSKYILSMKSYDAPEAGEYNRYEGVDYGSYENHIVEDESLVILIRGNNDWSTSNIRTWLNSDAEVVRYSDQAPTYKAVGSNYYESEPGFLHQFTDEEKTKLLTVEKKTKANKFSENTVNGNVITEDKVFFLSSEELAWVDEAGVSIYTKPTEKCKEYDEYLNYYLSSVKTYHTENYLWWLRDNSGEVINKVYVVNTEYFSDETYKDYGCGFSDIGVRPAITLGLEDVKLLLEDSVEEENE